MALVITTIQLESSYVPFERPPQDVTLWTAIPRGIQSFTASLATLDAKPFDDEQIVELRATLPPNFGYVMIDAALHIIQSQGLQWDDVCNLNLQNFYRAPQSISLPMSTNWAQDFLLFAQDIDQRVMVRRQPWPTYPMVGTSGTTGIQVNFSAFNNGSQTADPGFVSGFISFWQFDLEQIRKFPINTPIPTHSR